MKKLAPVLALFFVIGLLGCGPQFDQEFIATDLDHFWEAYEQINQTSDTILQKKYLEELYLDKASPGLEGLITVRNYTKQEFLTGITTYPEFWASIQPNMLQVESYYPEIQKDIAKLKKAYPELKPVPIYFTVGAFRSNGTTQGDKVLIGTELALGDAATVTHELPEWRQPFYAEYKPLEGLALLCTHEYIHTQQDEIVENLLSMSLYEGVAEFISCHVTGKPSSSPAIEFGKANEERVVKKFINDLYLMEYTYNWLWGENRNELEVRDLGYYIGYEIAERYYNKAEDKAQAIKELIELDYTNEDAVERIVDGSGLFPKTIEAIYQDYENARPTVVEILEFENGSQTVDPNTARITVKFSEALNGYNTGLDFGPLGQDYYPKVDNQTREWGADNLSYTFKVDLEPNQRYQLLISSNFRLENRIRLKPYLIDFHTSE